MKYLGKAIDEVRFTCSLHSRTCSNYAYLLIEFTDQIKEHDALFHEVNHWPHLPNNEHGWFEDGRWHLFVGPKEVSQPSIGQTLVKAMEECANHDVVPSYTANYCSHLKMTYGRATINLFKKIDTDKEEEILLAIKRQLKQLPGYRIAAMDILF